MNRPIYTAFNIVYEIMVLWCLLFFNTFVNDLLVPADVRGGWAHAWIKFFLIVMEAIALQAFIYAINYLVLGDTEDRDNRKLVAGRTFRGQLIITGCFVLLLMWGSFKGYLWL